MYKNVINFARRRPGIKIVVTHDVHLGLEGHTEVYFCRTNSVFRLRETASREIGLEDSRLLYTTQSYTPILAFFRFCVLLGTVT